MDGTQTAESVIFENLKFSELAPPESVGCFAKHFVHPDEVVSDPQLTQTEKRETLAFWASDVHAVPSAPTLRQLKGGAVVHIDDVLQALSSLDVVPDETAQPSKASSPLGIRPPRVRTYFGAGIRKWSANDDDDPPPCPVVSASPLNGPLLGGEAVEPVLSVAA